MLSSFRCKTATFSQPTRYLYFLHSHNILNLRYRKNYRKLPGSPDIAILKHKIAVFVDGEFWHGKDWDQKKECLKTNQEYWIEKIGENIARDKRNDLLLFEMGWKPIHFWEKEVIKSLQFCADSIIDAIKCEGEKTNDDPK